MGLANEQRHTDQRDIADLIIKEQTDKLQDEIPTVKKIHFLMNWSLNLQYTYCILKYFLYFCCAVRQWGEHLALGRVAVTVAMRVSAGQFIPQGRGEYQAHDKLPSAQLLSGLL